jgi:DNA-binding IclR family transcriptional regulator
MRLPLRSPRTACPHPTLGELLPAHATAAGKVLLAYRQPWRDSILTEPLHAYTDHTATSPADIEAAAVETRARGYAIDEAEYQEDTFAIAAPVAVDHQVDAAVAVSIETVAHPATRLDGLADRVLHTAAAISAARSESGVPRRD